ncbi:MAG: Xaa-Pro peptidase family protein [Syntrophomonas sp.]
MQKLRGVMQQKEVDAFLITKPENIRYLSGFTGGMDGRLVVTDNQQYLLTDSRYWEQASIESPQWELVKETTPGIDLLVDLVSKYKKLALESQHMTIESFRQLEARFENQLYLLSDIIEGLRTVKDETELNLLRRAAEISDEVFEDICQYIKVGLTERQIANRVVYLLKQKGCQKESFDTIAVSGPNAALPHGQPGDRILIDGDMLTLDFGGFYQGYAGDMTRTVIIGNGSQYLKDNYMRLLEAQQLGVSNVRSGMAGQEVDKLVRECLQKHSLDIYFAHSTGHGVGLEIHENPRLSRSSKSILEENMVVTVEPGIYIPGWGGIRIEDTVIVKNGGCEVITHSDKGLIIL